MYSFIVLLAIIIATIIYGIIEFFSHQRHVSSIPIRIHINGTRGKSSVTRLVGAGLRAGGISTITKVTGTLPCLILEDGKEVRIYRKSDPNIIEQLSIIRYAAKKQVHALVIECMALQPQYQRITEKQMIHSTVGAITNVRLDHIDVMGKTPPEIAQSLGETIPQKGLFFTAEKENLNLLLHIAEKKRASCITTESRDVTRKEMKGFSYIEHRENVALALAICEKFGVKRHIALEGMYDVSPDSGALQCFSVHSFHKNMKFYNAFAANDPESSYTIWNKITEEIGLEGVKIVLINTRHDRLDRARQLTEMVATSLADQVDYLMLIGDSPDVVENLAIKFGFEDSRIINLGWTTPATVFEEILSLTEDISSVFAIGNMGGMGNKVAEYFKHRSMVNND